MAKSEEQRRIEHQARLSRAVLVAYDAQMQLIAWNARRWAPDSVKRLGELVEEGNGYLERGCSTEEALRYLQAISDAWQIAAAALTKYQRPSQPQQLTLPSPPPIPFQRLPVEITLSEDALRAISADVSTIEARGEKATYKTFAAFRHIHLARAKNLLMQWREWQAHQEPQQ